MVPSGIGTLTLNHSPNVSFAKQLEIIFDTVQTGLIYIYVIIITVKRAHFLTV